MEQSMIDALKRGGSFTFVILVKRNAVEETRRNDVIELENNDINDPEVQAELKQYLAENDVISILLNGREVWHKRIISIDKALSYTVD